MQKNYNSGFTLVELAIVLVIIGLIVGGVLMGRDLIRGAEIRSVISEVEKYKTAVNAFRTTYNCLPGDCTNATDFWGAAHSNFVTCQTTQGTGTQTCNGDGDGKIEDPYFGNIIEMHRFWQQLANANLVAGNFTGISNTTCAFAGICTAVGINQPTSTYPSAGYHLYFAGSSDPAFFRYGFHALTMGTNRTNLWANSPALSPVDGHNIDNKMDDGRPGAGRVLSYTPTGIWTNCASSSTASSATYLLTVMDPTCTMVFQMPF